MKSRPASSRRLTVCRVLASFGIAAAMAMLPAAADAQPCLPEQPAA